MNVVNNFRKPFFPKQACNRLRLFQIEHEPIAIVVVAGVVVIKLRRLAAFIRRAQSLAVPIRNDIHAIGIRRRDQNQNCVAQDR